MTHRRKQRQVLENVVRLEYADGSVPLGTKPAPGTLLTLVQEFAPVIVHGIRADVSAPFPIIVTDSGGANGGFGSKSLLTLPAKRYQFLGVYVELAVTAGANISPTATITAAIGTAAEATNSTLDAAQADVMASQNIVLAASAGTLIVATSLASMFSALGFVNASAGNIQFFLNFGIPDASISAGSSLIVSGILKFYCVELGV